MGYTGDLRSLEGIATTRSRPRRRRSRKKGGGEPEKSNNAPNRTQHPHLVLVVSLLTPSSDRNKTKDQINCENNKKKRNQPKIKIKETQVVVYPRNACEMKTAAECVTYKAVG